MVLGTTLLYGGLGGLLLAGLGMNVSRLRGKLKVFVGQPIPDELQRPVRAHGNAAEWIPAGILLLAILELSGAAGQGALHALGGLFILSRLLHAFGILAKNPASTLGAGLNYVSITVMAAWAVVAHFR
jgi:uncharacterized membrane protein YecN with MAPEG domain